MRPLRRAAGVSIVAAALVAPVDRAAAATWDDVTATTIGPTLEWSNKVELADVDDDGDLDILFANGGDYDTAGSPEPLRVFANDGVGGFAEITEAVFGTERFLARSVKVRDVTGDGVADVVIGTTFQTQSRLFVGVRGGGFLDRTADLPAVELSVGDLELGDVDGDGDLDLMLADWGVGRPTLNAGGQPRLWLNDGAGGFVDATAARMPAVLVGMSWDLDFLDVDNDRDLDALIASKTSDGSTLLVNDGGGTFRDASAALPQFGNNYEFEPIDLDGDGLLDVVTINDGAGVREHVFRGDGAGFVDATEDWWPPAANPAGVDDNAAVFLDADGDGDPDVLIGSLGGGTGDDRVLLNDGAGHLTAGPQGFSTTDTPGTLGIAVGDLDGDGRLDVVQSQGESASPDRVYLGVDLPIDDDPPSVVEVAPENDPTIVARVHDHRSPVRPTDFQAVEVRHTDDASAVEQRTAMEWYGESLFRVRLDSSSHLVVVRVCATDAGGHEACTEPRTVYLRGWGDDIHTVEPDAGARADGGGGSGCGCGGPGAPGIGLLGGLALAAALARRRPPRGRALAGAASRLGERPSSGDADRERR